MQITATSPPAGADELSLSNEAALVGRARTDPEAVAQLYDLYVDRVYHYAFRRLGTHADAEDLTAQTFRRALEHLQSYEWRGMPFGAWLFRIAHNLVVDRHRGVEPPLSLDSLNDGGLPLNGTAADALDAQLAQREQTDAAWAAVATLPARQRRAVALRFGRDLSYAEVGVIIGRSEQATKQLIYRAMKTLRIRLEVSP